MYLESDFWDYYDFMFDLDGDEFERMSVTDLSRTEAFGKLTAMGLAVPQYGPASSLYTIFPMEELVVVYMDEYAHRSEGKVLMSIKRALGLDKNVSIYVPSEARSIRYLRIGTRVFWLLYTSTDEWRSNYGDVTISEWVAPAYLKDFKDREPVPLLAVDFVKCLYGGFLAIDYNTSPGLKGTPIQDMLSPTEVVDLIKEWRHVE